MKNIINPFSILASALRSYKQNFLKLLAMAAIVAIPGSFISVYQFDSVNDASIITSIAGLYLCVALIWSYFNIDKVKKNNIFKLYTLSSKRFLSYLFATMLFSIVCMPAVLSIVLIILAWSGQVTWIFLFLGILILIASIVLLVRFSLATTLVVQNDISAFDSMRLSWQVVRGNSITTLLAWGLILFIVVMISGVVFSVANISPVIAGSALIQLLLNGILLTFLLPVFISFGVELTNRLEQ